jgi:antirestriction protein ArdC
MLWSAAVPKGYACPLWLTFKQAIELGGHVRKGETGELVVYADRITRAETGDNGESTEREIAVLVNPANPVIAETTLRNVQEAARILGLQIHILKASTSREIDAAFATLERERADALFVAGDDLFVDRRVQLVNLAARDRIPATNSQRAWVQVGGPMSYATAN